VQGTVTNWKEVGGRFLPIRIIGRPAGSGARVVMDDVLGSPPDRVPQIVELSNGAVARAVEETPGAVGYVEGDRPWAGVAILQIDGRPYRRGDAWPLYATSRLYWRRTARGIVENLVATLAESPLRTPFGIVVTERGGRA
jgi:phosphate transport system substrate-binding protein